jgi:deoxyribodipyrimidine photo-lyase
MRNVRHARAIVWLRRDLRLDDNVALAAAGERSGEVVVAFIIDPELLRSERIGAPIVQTFFEALSRLRDDLRARGSDLALLEGDPARELPSFAKQIGAGAVFYNEDYDPAAIARDAAVTGALHRDGIEARSFLDHVCLGAQDVRTRSGEAYRVFTPYARSWRDRYAIAPVLPVDSLGAIDGTLASRETIGATRVIPTPEDFAFTSSRARPHCGEAVANEMLDAFLAEGGGVDRYAELRDVPSCDATSHLSVQLRAGTIGIRTCFARAYRAARDPARRASVETWISELIWREFYQMLLRCFPHVVTNAFVRGGDELPWENDERAFDAWCQGRTGYPIVDAAMRQLNETGWMHNRLRMIVASFLTKDLLVDWRWGERYFETHLADADLAQNNGGWQWAASTGADAAPYFRIFNPLLQSKTFDPDGAFIRTMIPELKDVPGEAIHAPWQHPLLQIDYPPPIVDHDHARARALAAYAPVLGKKGR